MSTDDASGYLPPHELRALFAQLGDRGEAGGVPHNPGPNVASSSPGLAGAAVTPPSGPAFAADDPNTIGIALAQMANQLFGISMVPVPTPESLTTGAGMASPIGPGSAPQGSLPASVPGLPDAIAPSLESLPEDQVPPTPATHGAAPGAPTAESPTMPGGSVAALPPETPSGAMPSGAMPSGAMPSGAMPSGAMPPGAMPSGAMPAGAPTAPNPFGDIDLGPLLSTHGAPLGWTTAAPGRPSGVGIPASNVALPGGVSAPGAVIPSSPSVPFGSAGESTGNAIVAAAGVTPPIGGAGIQKPTSTGLTVPTSAELEAITDPAFGIPISLVTQPVGSVSDSTMPSPSSAAVPADVAAPPTAGEGNGGAGPFAPTRLDDWNPFGSHGRGGRLPLVGDAPLISEPVVAPNYQLPLIESADGSAPGARGYHPFDPYEVRKDFPILEERVHGGKRVVWLDNAATTQKPRAVIDRLTRFYEHENSNVHRAAHTLAARATDAFESARETTRKFLNAPSSSEIIFVRGATEGINLIAKSWGRKNIGAGDEILLTHLEHHANIVPWQQLCARVGAKLRVAPVDDRGDVILEAYEKLIGKRTKLVAFTQVSNALGTITPAREMIEIAHRHGATVLLDGAQAVSHMPVDVQALGCDFYVFSGHKVFAPTGIGAVFGKKDILEDMPPWQGGGNMIADVTFEKTVYQQPPWRFEAGTGNIADAAGMGAALDYVMRIGMNVIDRYEHELLVYATHELARVPGLKMIGTSVNKAGVLSFVLDGQRTEEVGAALDKHGIAVRSGHHCAQPILRRFGLEASVRASLAFYNVREDIDQLVVALLEIQSGRKPISA